MRTFVVLIGVVVLGLMFTACGDDKEKIYSVGIINIVPDLDQTVMGFKQGLAERGYHEGENIRYSYPGATTDLNTLPAVAQALVSARSDLVFSITTPATLAAKQATAGVGMPVLFAVVTDPVGAGIVESIQHPGSNVTGVAFGIQEARRLEWLLRIAPGIRQVYVPYNAEDKAPVLALDVAQDAAAKLGVRLIPQPFHDLETLDRAVMHIPAEADAVFLLPDSLMGTRLKDIVGMSIRRKLPTSVSNTSAVRENIILTSYGFDQHQCGIQTARLADQILKGIRPQDLPVETAELHLAINLKAAKAIGLAIPDGILGQADIIIR